jgi:methyl coenzyme M reductase gamma subunit
VATTIATPEGHAIRLDEDGEMIGLTIVNARWLLDRDGKVVVTLPERIELPREELDQALTS